MENANERWVLEQIAYLDPPAAWQPDSAAAVARFRTREQASSRARPWRPWLAWVAAAAGLAGLIALFPDGRAAAQQLWQFLAVPRVAFIRVNPWPEGVPSPQVKAIGTMIPPIPARSLEQVRWRVNYQPRLPRPGVLSGSPLLSTTFSLSAGTVVKAADLQLALRKAGANNSTVPPQWDGAQLTLHTSALVIAEWPGIVLVQSLPPTLTAPPGFDYPAFSALVLRVLGVEPDTARRLAQQAGTAPPWLVPISDDLEKMVALEEITLSFGPATLVQQGGQAGASKRISVFWCVSDRVYLMSGVMSRELAIAAANAVQ